ncbi:MAG: hypothetical protein HQ546_04650, partial [Planctomycetes bacterium]|nr:hypothetical protein [Planctomycetota bacterium]
MQTLSWYYRRLRAMSPREVIWRIKCSLRDATDRAFLNRRQRLLAIGDLLAFGGANASPRFRVSDITVGQWAGEQAGQTERRWLEKLEARADRIAAHRLRLFDLEDCHLGDPIDWNRDHKLNKTTPMTFAPSIDYRDTNVAGDCKFVWEPSRHHQLVVLGRAYRAGGDERYAKAVVEQLDSWLVQCPFG